MGEAIEEVMKAALKTLSADVYEKLSEDKIDENLRELSQPQERFAPKFERNQDFFIFF